MQAHAAAMTLGNIYNNVQHPAPPIHSPAAGTTIYAAIMRMIARTTELVTVRVGAGMTGHVTKVHGMTLILVVTPVVIALVLGTKEEKDLVQQHVARTTAGRITSNA